MEASVRDKYYNSVNSKIISDLIIECSQELTSVINISEFEKISKGDVKKVTVSAAIIVKNEERCILRCINSIINEVDEIVVIDTGSTDRTLEIISNIESRKIRVYTKEWNDNFSDIRNYAIEKVVSEWIFFIDADEYLMKNDIELKSLLTFFDEFKKVENFVIAPKIIDCSGDAKIGVPRIFKKNVQTRFYGLIHEEIRIKEDESVYLPIRVSVNLPIWHDGYTEKVMCEKNKKERNLRLNKRMMNLEPNNLRWVYFYLRDSQGDVSIEETKLYINRYLLKDSSDCITYDNLINDAYTYAIMMLYISRYIYEGNCDEEARRLLDILKLLGGENNDYMYLMGILEINSLKSNRYKFLKQLLDYRKNNLETQYGTMHSDGQNIDVLIGYFLIEVGYIEKGIKYYAMAEKFAEGNVLVLESKKKIENIKSLMI